MSVGVSHLFFSHGTLDQVAPNVCAAAVCVQAANLLLDDLEAGSLRGSLASASAEANMEARQGA